MYHPGLEAQPGTCWAMYEACVGSDTSSESDAHCRAAILAPCACAVGYFMCLHDTGGDTPHCLYEDHPRCLSIAGP
jgi:hypothetical protein